MSDQLIFGALTQKAPAYEKPENEEKEDASSDVTSIFGSRDKDYLNVVNKNLSYENDDTPFSRMNFLQRVFPDNEYTKEYYEYQDEDDPTTLQFEC